MKLYLMVFLLAVLGACASVPEPHPWGPGGTVWWDKVRADKSTIDSRPIDRSDSFWAASRRSF